MDELATYYCTFKLFVDSSTSAISNVSAIRDLIPKQKFANNADILSTLRAAPDVLSHFLLYHVTSHQDATTDFDSLPFEAQLNVLFDCIATDQLARQGVNVGERTQSCSHCPASHLPVEVFLGHQNIQSHYIPRLRDALSSRRHRAFLQKNIFGMIAPPQHLLGSLSLYVVIAPVVTMHRLDQRWSTTG